MSALVEVLDRYLSLLVAMGFRVDKYLEKGKKIDEIEILFSVNCIPISETLVELFNWRNGTPYAENLLIDAIQFIPGYQLLSLEEAILIYKMGTEVNGFDKRFFPILSDNCGGYFCLSNEEIFDCVNGYEPALNYRSLRKMFETHITAIEHNLIFIEKGRYLEMDDLGFGDLAKTMNPDVAFWTS